jgi:hypothetical protein
MIDSLFENVLTRITSDKSVSRLIGRLFTLGLLLSVLTLTTVAQAAEGPTFTLAPDWPKPLPNQWIMGSIGGLSVDNQGHIWVSQAVVRNPAPGSVMAKLMGPNAPKCCDAPQIIEFDQEGNVVQAWGGPGKGYDWPQAAHGLFVDHNGFVWIAGTLKGDGQVLKFTRDGKFVMQIGHPGGPRSAADPTVFDRPANMFVDPKTNELYVADGYGNRRVIVFDAESGKFKRMWGAYGKPPVDRGPNALNNYTNSDPVDPTGPAPEHFNSPVHCVVLSKDDRVYVCDRSNSRVQVFRPDGSFLQEFLYGRTPKDFGGEGQITDMALWPDAKQSYLIAASSVMLVIRRSDGEVLSRFGTPGELIVHLITMDQHGNLYTGELLKGVRKWVPSDSPGR